MAVTLNHVLELIPEDATWQSRPGPALSVTFASSEQRNQFRTRFYGTDLAVAGTTFTLNHERTWIDEHGFGLVLSHQATS